jgi:hypothetical protein
MGLVLELLVELWLDLFFLSPFQVHGQIIQ